MYIEVRPSQWIASLYLKPEENGTYFLENLCHIFHRNNNQIRANKWVWIVIQQNDFEPNTLKTVLTIKPCWFRGYINAMLILNQL